MTYKILIQTENAGTLVFRGVKSYSEEGSFIKFKDEMTSKILLYPLVKSRIEEEE